MYEQFGLLAGKSAPHDFIQLVVYKAMTFSEHIDKIDTVRAYHVRSVFILLYDNDPQGNILHPERPGQSSYL